MGKLWWQLSQSENGRSVLVCSKWGAAHRGSHVPVGCACVADFSLLSKASCNIMKSPKSSVLPRGPLDVARSNWESNCWPWFMEQPSHWKTTVTQAADCDWPVADYSALVLLLWLMCVHYNLETFSLMLLLQYACWCTASTHSLHTKARVCLHCSRQRHVILYKGTRPSGCFPLFLVKHWCYLLTINSFTLIWRQFLLPLPYSPYIVAVCPCMSVPL